MPKVGNSSSTPKTVLDKIKATIVALDQENCSRQAITKHLKVKFAYDNPSALKKALQKGVESGTLTQTGQSFSLRGHVPSKKVEEDPLKIEEIKVGSGKEAVKHSECIMKYKGCLVDGTKFDSANKFKFLLGAGDVIKGWDQGVLGMREGGKRKLTVPSKLGYGKRGSPPEIPPNATLIFDIELVKVE